MPRSAQQAGRAADVYKVFLSTNKSTSLFLKCHPNTRICDLQGEIATEHRAQYPEHGHVHCQRLLTSLEFKHRVQHGYAIPGTYCMSDLSFNAHTISSAQFVFRLQAELVNGQASQESQQLHQLDTDQPLLALPVPPAQPAASTGPAATAVLQPDTADDASVQEQSAEERPKKKKKHKKRKREAEAEEEAQQIGDSDHPEDADGVTVRQRTKKRKKSRSHEQPEQEEAADAEEQQPAKKKKKQKHQSTDSADAVADAQQPVTADEEEPEPSEAAPEQHEDTVAAEADAAAADDAAEPDATAAASTKRKKKKKKRKTSSAAGAAAAANAEVAEPAEIAAEAAIEAPAADDDDQVVEADMAAQASADGSPGEDSAEPAQSKKKKKKKKKRKSTRQEPESEGEPSQAAAEQQQAAAGADGHPDSSQADVDDAAATAAAAEVTGAQPATSEASQGASLQTSSRKKKRAQKSLAEATAAYPGCTLPAELAGDAPTGQLAAGPSEPAQDVDDAEAEPISSGWKKRRRRELLPELDAAEDKPEDPAGEEEEQEDSGQAVNGQAADAPAEEEAQGAVSSDSFQPSSSSDDEDAVEPEQPQEGAEVHVAAGAADEGPTSSDSSGAEANSADDEEAVQPQQPPAGVGVNGVAGAADEGSTTSSEVTDSTGDEASSESDDQAFRIQGATQDGVTRPLTPENGNDPLHAGAGGAEHAAPTNGASSESDRAGQPQPNGTMPEDRDVASSSGDSGDTDNSEDEAPPDPLVAGSAVKKRPKAPDADNPYEGYDMAGLLEAAAKTQGLESARGLETEEQQEEANPRPNRRRHLVNPMTAVVAQRESQGPSQPQGQKKRGRPAKGTFTVTEDSDLLDQVARRPVQDWGTAIKQASVLKRAVKAWLNEDRVAKGLKEVHSSIYQHNSAPEWWPLPQFDSSQIERKAPCQQVYAALQKYMRENGQHQGAPSQPQT